MYTLEWKKKKKEISTTTCVLRFSGFTKVFRRKNNTKSLWHVNNNNVLGSLWWRWGFSWASVAGLVVRVNTNAADGQRYARPCRSHYRATVLAVVLHTSNNTHNNTRWWANGRRGTRGFVSRQRYHVHIPHQSISRVTRFGRWWCRTVVSRI